MSSLRCALRQSLESILPSAAEEGWEWQPFPKAKKPKAKSAAASDGLPTADSSKSGVSKEPNSAPVEVSRDASLSQTAIKSRSGLRVKIVAANGRTRAVRDAR